MLSDGFLVSVELTLVCHMVSMKPVRDEGERFLASNLFSISEQLTCVFWCLMAELVSGYSIDQYPAT